MYGSGPLDDDNDDNYEPPSQPSVEEQMKMVKQGIKSDQKLREEERKKKRKS